MKVKLLTLLLLLLTGTYACKSAKNQEFNLKNTLRLNLRDDPSTLVPQLARQLKDLTLVKQLFEGLMRMNAEGIPYPAIAERVEVSTDGLIYTFYLRDSCWNNGTPVKAADFFYAWSQVLNSSFGSDYAYLLYPIKNAQKFHRGECELKELGIEIVDEKIFRVELSLPTPYFLELTTFPTYFPIHSHSEFSCASTASFICNGPFCLKKWDPQKEICLQKNPFYWDKSAVHLEGITFSIVQDSTTECYLFEKNELDWLGQPISNPISSEFLQKMKATGEVHSYAVSGTSWLVFNLEKQPFNNHNLRKAFAYAINREEIITHVLQGNQKVATSPVPSSMSLTAFHYFKDGDSKEAKKLFVQAFEEENWTLDTFPKIQLSYPVSERNTKIVQLIQQQLQTILGIKLELIALEKHLCKHQIKEGDYQISLSEWIADYHDPLAFLELFKYKNSPLTGHGINESMWNDSTYVYLLNQAASECDIKKRKDFLQNAERILMEQMPIAPLYHYSFDYLKKPYVENVFLSPLGVADFKMVTLTR